MLHLRFQAELNQMESIQEAERQLNQLNEIRNVVEARNDAANMASFARVSFFIHKQIFKTNIILLHYTRHWYHLLDLQDQGNKVMVTVLKRLEASLKNA